MNLPKILLTGILTGFTSGFLATNTYHLNTRKKERRVFIECQQAWEKYYSLTNRTNQVTQPIITNQSLWPALINGALNIVQDKVITTSNQPFNLDQQKYLAYQYEVLPKCQKIKAWEKEVDKLISQG